MKEEKDNFFKIKLTAPNGTKKLTAWVNQFLAVDTSLILEVDMKHSCFVVKAFTSDNAFVVKSSLRFDEAELVVRSDEKKEIEGNDYNYRLKIGILLNLDKFISIIKSFNTEECSITLDNFSDVAEHINDKDGSVLNYHNCQKVSFKSKRLKMNFICADANYFRFISDETFEKKAYILNDYLEVELPYSVFKESVDINNIYNTDQKNDLYVFNYDHKHNALVATDNQKLDVANFNIILKDGYTEEELSVMNPFMSYKRYINIFLKSVRDGYGDVENITFRLPKGEINKYNNRILIEIPYAQVCIGGVVTADIKTI